MKKYTHRREDTMNKLSKKVIGIPTHIPMINEAITVGRAILLV